MQKVNLTAGEVCKLFRNGNIEFGEKKSVILLKDDIVINDNGRVYLPVNMQISYEPRSDYLDENIKFLQNLICEHLNLEPYQVMYLTGGGEEYEFRIALSPDNLGQIAVLTKRLVMNSLGIPVELETDLPCIDIYRRLGNSFYYFLWYENFFSD